MKSPDFTEQELYLITFFLQVMYNTHKNNPTIEPIMKSIHSKIMNNTNAATFHSDLIRSLPIDLVQENPCNSQP